MTEQNKPGQPSSLAPQKPNQQNRPPIRPVARPQTGGINQRPTGQIHPQAQRTIPQNQPSVRRMIPPQSGTRPISQGMHQPIRQGQIPPQRRVNAQNIPQRPIQTQQPSIQRPVAQQASQMPQQNVMPNKAAMSQQTPQLSPMQAFLLNSRNLAFLLLGTVIFGILLGAMMFGGSSKPVSRGLQNIVKNSDIRQPLPFCGRVHKGQACVLYIMNASRYDQMAENFFNEALKLTEVPLRSISWANPKYAKQRIPPGAFAEIFIPNTR